jgi:hypothetical protein
MSWSPKRYCNSSLGAQKQKTMPHPPSKGVSQMKKHPSKHFTPPYHTCCTLGLDMKMLLHVQDLAIGQTLQHWMTNMYL